MTSGAVRSVVVTEPGDTGVLEVQPRVLPDPGPGELRVEVAASGINFIDVYRRQGVYPTPTPFVLGTEGAGTVSVVGDGVTGIKVGDVVAWAAANGSHAEAVVLAADQAVPVPDGVPAEVAAAAMLQGMTAHYLVSSTYPVQPGDSVLVHAAAGGVGQLLIQLAQARGARVIGTVSTEEKAAKARAAGADAVLIYSEVYGQVPGQVPGGSENPQALADAVRAANGGAGVSVAYDGVGDATFEASLRSLAPRGMAVLFGGSSGQVAPLDLQRLNALGGLFVTRPSLGHYTATRDELLWRGLDILRDIADGGLRIEIGGRYPLEDTGRAFDDLENRRSTGKLIITR